MVDSNRIMKKPGIFVLFLIIVAAFVFDFYPVDAIGTPDDDYQMAPDFTLTSINGEEITLSDYRGKVVVINFWATWCGPCRYEIPMLIEFQEQYGTDKLIVLGVAINSGSKEEVQKFAAEFNINYPILHGSDEDLGKLVYLYGNFASIPSTFIVNGKGEVTNFIKGAQSRNVFQTNIEQQLELNL
ncbi:TlpA family protein disulfide reductase [Candidatus Marinimicrobia bacterium MT.SAG.2]|nr:TlpA family protein disulfide reductase [Candidatus Marinimicrobia bacterium MT.SAG.2]